MSVPIITMMVLVGLIAFVLLALTHRALLRQSASGQNLLVRSWIASTIFLLWSVASIFMGLVSSFGEIAEGVDPSKKAAYLTDSIVKTMWVGGFGVSAGLIALIWCFALLMLNVAKQRESHAP